MLMIKFSDCIDTDERSRHRERGRIPKAHNEIYIGLNEEIKKE
jgi:hypothetical protein